MDDHRRSNGIRAYHFCIILLLILLSAIHWIPAVHAASDNTIIGFRWDMPIRYIPSWMELVVTLAVIFTEIWVFRWVINRMPVLRDPPSWTGENH